MTLLAVLTSASASRGARLFVGRTAGSGRVAQCFSSQARPFINNDTPSRADDATSRKKGFQFPAHDRRRTGKLWASQSLLPRLPLPRLENTLEKYLDSVAPIVGSSIDATKRAVEHDLQPGSALRSAHQTRAP